MYNSVFLKLKNLFILKIDCDLAARVRCSFKRAEICGSDGKTYRNACLMLGESCRAGTPYVVKVSDGKCK